MSQPFNLASGKWVHFDRYEVRDRCIAPAPGARMHVYDPWKLDERPYKALAQLVTSRLAREVLTLPAEQPELVAGILDWCNQYGLLGTLYHRIAMVTLWPRWERVRFDDKQVRDVFQPTQETHVCLPSAWRTETVLFPTRIIKAPSRLGTPLTAAEMPLNARTPSALVMDIDGSAINEEPLEKTWADHFPDVPQSERTTYAYPHPTSKEFWQLYAEPVWEFAHAAWRLANCLEAISRHAAPFFYGGVKTLAHLASCGAPYLEPQRGGSLRQRWLAGSLMSSLAFMAMEDLSQGLLHQCETCRKFFISDAYQAEYCSATCRHTMQKRRYRDRKRKAERPMKRKGR